MKVSIILPVYNGEKHLIPCLESLLKQTISEYEVICINDGSKDRSGQILEEYQKKYPQIFRVFHKENEGVYRAREYGLKHSSGKYIGFCDCDDVVDEKIYETLYQCAIKENAEMAICAYTRVDEMNEKVLCYEMKQFGNETISVEEQKDKLAVINTALWNKLILREVALKHICFEKAPRVAEDMMFLLSLYPFVKKITFCDKALYKYYVRKSSAMSYVKEEELLNLQKCMIQTKNVVQEQKGYTWDDVINTFAFIHFGIAFVLNFSKTNSKKVIMMQKKIEQWLNENFSNWKKNKYLQFHYVFFGHTYLVKPMIILYIYKMKMLPMFFKVYIWITGYLKIDIKW